MTRTEANATLAAIPVRNAHAQRMLIGEVVKAAREGDRDSVRYWQAQLDAVRYPDSYLEADSMMVGTSRSH